MDTGDRIDTTRPMTGEGAGRIRTRWDALEELVGPSLLTLVGIGTIGWLAVRYEAVLTVPLTVRALAPLWASFLTGHILVLRRKRTVVQFWVGLVLVASAYMLLSLAVLAISKQLPAPEAAR